MEIFPPPQGGIWTELDVSIHGLDPEDILTVAFEVFDGAGAPIGGSSYDATRLPLACAPALVVELDNVPVSFGDNPTFEALDGIEATVVATIGTPADDVTHELSVTLRRTVY